MRPEITSAPASAQLEISVIIAARTRASKGEILTDIMAGEVLGRAANLQKMGALRDPHIAGYLRFIARDPAVWEGLVGRITANRAAAKDSPDIEVDKQIRNDLELAEVLGMGENTQIAPYLDLIKADYQASIPPTTAPAEPQVAEAAAPADESAVPNIGTINVDLPAPVSATPNLGDERAAPTDAEPVREVNLSLAEDLRNRGTWIQHSFISNPPTEPSIEDDTVDYFWRNVDILWQGGVNYDDNVRVLPPAFDENHIGRTYERRILDQSGSEIGVWTKQAYISKKVDPQRLTSVIERVRSSKSGNWEQVIVGIDEKGRIMSVSRNTSVNNVLSNTQTLHYRYSKYNNNLAGLEMTEVDPHTGRVVSEEKIL